MSQTPLTAREAYQVLRDIALGIRVMRRVGDSSRQAINGEPVTVHADGWVITFYNDGEALGYCDSCQDPEGRTYRFDTSQRFGTDPVELLSTWERAQLERLLGQL